MIKTSILPTDIFDEAALKETLGLRANTVAREILLGRLRCYRRSRRTFFLGSDILDWLRAGEVRPDQLPEDETDP